MTDEEKQFAHLIDEGMEPKQKDIDVKQFPITIYVNVGNEAKAFYSEAADWGWTPDGVFASGKLEAEDVKRDLLIPYESVAYYELHDLEDE